MSVCALELIAARHCVLLLLMFLDGGGALNDGSCLPWTYRPNATSPCKCGSTVSGAIHRWRKLFSTGGGAPSSGNKHEAGNFICFFVPCVW